MKIRSVEAKLLYADGRTDRQTRRNLQSLLEFENVPKIVKLCLTLSGYIRTQLHRFIYLKLLVGSHRHIHFNCHILTSVYRLYELVCFCPTYTKLQILREEKEEAEEQSFKSTFVFENIENLYRQTQLGSYLYPVSLIN